jgi:hypothetical protein
MKAVRSILFSVMMIAGLCGCMEAFRQKQVSGYQPVQGKIMTRWAAQVRPDKVHQEYPRPQMVRKTWMNLNGLWEYAIRAKDQSQPETFDGQILVPFAVESALSGVGKTVTPRDKLWYRRTIDIPADWFKNRLLLHFGAVDWQAEIWLNGTKIGDHAGGYDPFCLDITDIVKRSGPQELIVSVVDPTNTGTQPRGKQVLKPGGIMYTAVTGIWQTVWIEPVPAGYLRGLHITPDIDRGQVEIAVDAVGAEGCQFFARVGGKSRITSDKAAFSMDVPDARLWSPDSPYLYDLTVSLMKNGKPVDSVSSYFGMRKIALGKDDKGITRLMLNNKPVFQYGPLDQGWWPDGLYTAPSDAALRYDIEVLKKIGCNMMRKHVKVEPARLYYWCDKLGLLVWQDMPSGDRGIGGNDPDLQRSPESANQFELELVRMIDAFRNHPSIVMWVPFNEGWGQYDTPRIVNLIKEYDPSRLVNNASGWTDRNVGDVIDMHNYPGPGMPAVEDKRAAVLGEFGGLGLPLPGHTWQEEKNWGYRSYTTREELTEAYQTLIANLRMLIPQGLCAAVYTQTTDVEVEINGWLTYDREILKIDAGKMATANRRLYLPAPEIRERIPTSQKEAANWLYTTTKPADGWELPGFEPKDWKEGPAGFGTEGTPGTVVRTVWNSPEIWLRRTIDLPGTKTGDINLIIHHDEDAQVFINGVLAASPKGYTSGYKTEPISLKAKQAIKTGRNTLAVYCKQTSGGQYIDVGLIEVVDSAK